LGTLAHSGSIAPEPSLNRVFILHRSYGSSEGILVYDSETFLKVGELDIDAVSSSSKRIIRVGTDAVAFIADSESVVIVRHPLFGP
jgi:hypothetical protein